MRNSKRISELSYPSFTSSYAIKTLSGVEEVMGSNVPGIKPTVILSEESLSIVGRPDRELDYSIISKCLNEALTHQLRLTDTVKEDIVILVGPDISPRQVLNIIDKTPITPLYLYDAGIEKYDSNLGCIDYSNPNYDHQKENLEMTLPRWRIKKSSNAVNALILNQQL